MLKELPLRERDLALTGSISPPSRGGSFSRMRTGRWPTSDCVLTSSLIHQELSDCGPRHLPLDCDAHSTTRATRGAPSAGKESSSVGLPVARLTTSLPGMLITFSLDHEAVKTTKIIFSCYASDATALRAPETIQRG